ncbi:MAG: endonuclease/exonuclease/phosphatase family protein [Chloroflexota bacterium]|nr:endonuclease/exonuclease/phosphatase family protein [Chloroflexota bacterium]
MFAIIAVLLFLLLSNVSVPGSRVEGCLSSCSNAGGLNADSIRVISLNMLHGYQNFDNLSARLDLIAGEIQSLDADIVLLQEVPWTQGTGNAAEHLSQRLGMNYAYYRANGNRKIIGFEEGEAILSRYPIENPKGIELHPRASVFEHRVVLQASIATHLGEVLVFVTHLTNGDPDINAKQSAALLEYVDQQDICYRIVAGDLNAQEDSVQIKSLSDCWIDTYRIVNPDLNGFTCCIDNINSAPDETLEKRIDYIFIAPGDDTVINISDSQLVFDQPSRVRNSWLWASDHIGLSVTLGIEEELED